MSVSKRPGSRSRAEPQRDPPCDAMSALCFHCGEPVSGGRWRLELDSAPRAFCCAGCLAVARTIRAAGLADFYVRRTAHAATPGEENDEWAQYDILVEDAALAAPDGATQEIALLLEGMRCAACVWLSETYVRRLPGVREFSVNFATRRARLVWSPGETRLSPVLRAIAAIGYRAYPYDPARREALVRREGRALLARTAVALLAMMQVMMFAVPRYVSAEPIEPAYAQLLDWASLLLTLPVVVYCAAPFFAGALRDLELRRLGMEVPVALGIGAAFVYSAWCTAAGSGPVYFDSVTMFVALLLVARYVEFAVRQRAGAAIESVARDRPETAERLLEYPASERWERVAASRLAAGDVIRVAAGAVVPADGVVLDGRSSVEEAIVTGESWPRAKGPGARLLAGSVNRESPLTVRVTAAGEATTAAALARLVARAAEAKPRLARIADRAAAWFVGALLAVAAGSALAWFALDASRALGVAVAVLIVSCPCALSLATPAALAAGAGALGRRGILAVRPDALETLSRVTHLVLDKTGTLTRGALRLSTVQPLGDLTREQCIATAAALERGSTHPIAAALRAAGSLDMNASDVVAVPGQGVEGTIDGRRYRCGRPAWAGALHGAPLPGDDVAPDAVRVALADESGWLAWLALSDELRAGARELVAIARSLGIAVCLLSGDRRPTVEHAAKLAGIVEYVTDAAPEEKRAFVAALQRDGAVVAMVGDGINDAPSLAQADVSLSLGSANALTQWTADVVVVGDDLHEVGIAMSASRRIFRVVRQNLAWALAYNAIAIPLAAAGQLVPLAAAVGMSASSILVVANASRLARLDPATKGFATPHRAPTRPGWRWKSSTC